MKGDVKEIYFFAQGIPKGQPRPRAFARKMGDKFVARVYDAGTAEAWKSCVALAAKPFVKEMFMEPVSVHMVFNMPRPKSHYLRGQLRKNAPVYHSIKPDADNIFKATADALKTIGLLSDDSIIVRLNLTKSYAINGHTGAAITIMQIA